MVYTNKNIQFSELINFLNLLIDMGSLMVQVYYSTMWIIPMFIGPVNLIDRFPNVSEMFCYIVYVSWQTAAESKISYNVVNRCQGFSQWRIQKFWKGGRKTIYQFN